MSLSGTLKDFSISEVFQLISTQQKSGILTISTESERAQVAFDGGMVVAAGSDMKKADDFLGQKLIRAGLVSREKCEEALDVQKSTGQLLGDILIEQGAIDKDAVRKVLLLQVREAVYRVLEIQEGKYEFTEQVVKYDSSFNTPLSSEYLLMEGTRIVEEWPSVREKIPSSDIVFRPAGSAPLPAGIPEEEGTVYRLVNGARTVREIVDISQLVEFEATKALAGLLARAVIERVPEAPAAAPARPAGRDLKALASNVLSLALIGVVVVLIMGYARMTGKKFRGEAGKKEISIIHSKESLGLSQWERIRNAVELFCLEHEKYPESLDDLVAEKYLAPDELIFPWDKRYYYQKRGGEYLLLQPKR